MTHFFTRFVRGAMVAIATVGMVTSAAVAQAPNPNLPAYPVPPEGDENLVAYRIYHWRAYKDKCRTPAVEAEIKALEGNRGEITGEIPRLKTEITDLALQGAANSRIAIAQKKMDLETDDYRLLVINYLLALLNAKPPCDVTPPPPPPPPVSHAVSSVPHLITYCEKCQPWVDAYNKAADSYAAAVRLHDPDQAVFRQQMAEAQRELASCESTCKVETPPPQTPRPLGGGFYERGGATVPVSTIGNPAYNTPFYNSPLAAFFYNTPYYNSPFEALFYNTPFYNTPYNYDLSESLGGPYLAVKTGPVWLPTTTTTMRFSDGGDEKFNLHYNTGYDVGVRGGDQFGPWRLEGELNFRYNGIYKISFADDSERAAGHTTAFIGMANAIHDFRAPIFGAVTPHLGAGVGFAHLSTEIKLTGTMPILNANDTEFAYQAIAGFRYPMTPNWNLDVDYRYLATADASYRDSFGNKYDLGYSSHTLLMSFSYRFGVPLPKPPSPPAPPPPPRSEMPQAGQVASLVPVEAAATATHRFTLRCDEANAVLSPTGVRALHEALDAIEAGQDVRIAIAGCETDADYADGSLCAHHALRLRHLLARYGVENPGHLLVRG